MCFLLLLFCRGFERQNQRFNSFRSLGYLAQKWRFLLPCEIVWKMTLCFEPPGQFDSSAAVKGKTSFWNTQWRQCCILRRHHVTFGSLPALPLFWILPLLGNPASSRSLFNYTTPYRKQPLALGKRDLKIMTLCFLVTYSDWLCATASFWSPVHNFVFPSGACYAALMSLLSLASAESKRS